MAAPALTEEWAGRDVSVGEIEHELARLRDAARSEDEAADLRTSVMTHIAWVPADWLEPAHDVLAGLAERHPSRTIVLVPKPDSKRDALDAELSFQCFPFGARHVCTETIELELLGDRTRAPGSIVQPLLVSDLPVFCRWRGEPPWQEEQFEQLVEVVDRLVLDSAEWKAPAASYERLTELFDRVAVSDIAWARTLGWRRALAAEWPGIAQATELKIAAPAAESALLAGWLRARLERELELVHDDADEVELVAIDGEGIEPPRIDRLSPADLLSNELDRFGRDRIYESAVSCAAK